MTKNSIARICALSAGILALTAPAYAGNSVVADGKESKKNVVEQTKESCITGDIGLNVVSQYISRGLVLENQGAILQPFADLYFQIYKGDGFLNKVTANVSVWDSFHDRKTDAGGATGVGRTGVTTPTWYESDFYAGLSFTVAKNLTITPSFYWFLSPNSAFSTFYGLNVNVAYDDTDLLHAFALHPHFTVLFELDNKAGSGTDEGIYYELGIAPAVPVGPVTFSLPVTAGFGSHNFYAENQGFGYISAGVNAAYAMKFIPACLGTWTLNASTTYYYLNDSLREFNSINTGGDIRTPRNSEWVFSGGLTIAF